MGRPGRISPLIRPAPSPLRARLSRLWRRRKPAAATTTAAVPAADPLIAAGQLLREARERRGLGLRQLAQETRISTPVLEALERGWRDRLPESTYLRTMLPLIERHLELEPASLQKLLPSEPLPGQKLRGSSLLRRFTPGSIDVFTTWQGTVLYGVLTLGLIYALNLQQQRLARAGWRAVAPLPVAPEPTSARRGKAGGQPSRGTSLLLEGYPELRPLDQAGQGQALRLWRRASSP
ncbi:MAG: helix-turn-helix domain-containing protein [Cyanobium sp. M30B3]|nr:MAG: helix-turn-helix domain-containing protein [Cyanobium sp. M30B3]